MKIILASASPRRAELLTLAGFEFEVHPSDADENIVFGGDCAAYTKSLAKIKGEAVKKAYPGDITVASDTIVTLDGKILGKPHSEDEARRMLRSLSGRTHEVYTGVYIAKNEIEYNFATCTEVTFFELSDEDIEDYIKTGDPFDKAGAYGVQSKGCVLVKEIRGDYYTVVGLPIAEVARILKKEL